MGSDKGRIASKNDAPSYVRCLGCDQEFLNEAVWAAHRDYIDLNFGGDCKNRFAAREA